MLMFLSTNLAWNDLSCRSNRRSWYMWFCAQSPEQSSALRVPIGAKLKWTPASMRNVYPSLAQSLYAQSSGVFCLHFPFCTTSSSVPFLTGTCTKWTLCDDKNSYLKDTEGKQMNCVCVIKWKGTVGGGGGKRLEGIWENAFQTFLKVVNMF